MREIEEVVIRKVLEIEESSRTGKQWLRLIWQ